MIVCNRLPPATDAQTSSRSISTTLVPPIHAHDGAAQTLSTTPGVIKGRRKPHQHRTAVSYAHTRSSSQASSIASQTSSIPWPSKENHDPSAEQRGSTPPYACTPAESHAHPHATASTDASIMRKRRRPPTPIGSSSSTSSPPPNIFRRRIRYSYEQIKKTISPGGSNGSTTIKERLKVREQPRRGQSTKTNGSHTSSSDSGSGEGSNRSSRRVTAWLKTTTTTTTTTYSSRSARPSPPPGPAGTFGPSFGKIFGDTHFSGVMPPGTVCPTFVSPPIHGNGTGDARSNDDSSSTTVRYHGGARLFSRELVERQQPKTLTGAADLSMYLDPLYGIPESTRSREEIKRRNAFEEERRGMLQEANLRARRHTTTAAALTDMPAKAEALRAAMKVATAAAMPQVDATSSHDRAHHSRKELPPDSPRPHARQPTQRARLRTDGSTVGSEDVQILAGIPNSLSFARNPAATADATPRLAPQSHRHHISIVPPTPLAEVEMLEADRPSPAALSSSMDCYEPEAGAELEAADKTSSIPPAMADVDTDVAMHTAEYRDSSQGHEAVEEQEDETEQMQRLLIAQRLMNQVIAQLRVSAAGSAATSPPTGRQGPPHAHLSRTSLDSPGIGRALPPHLMSESRRSLARELVGNGDVERSQDISTAALANNSSGEIARPMHSTPSFQFNISTFGIIGHDESTSTSTGTESASMSRSRSRSSASPFPGPITPSLEGCGPTLPAGFTPQKEDEHGEDPFAYSLRDAEMDSSVAPAPLPAAQDFAVAEPANATSESLQSWFDTNFAHIMLGPPPSSSSLTSAPVSPLTRSEPIAILAPSPSHAHGYQHQDGSQSLEGPPVQLTGFLAPLRRNAGTPEDFAPLASMTLTGNMQEVAAEAEAALAAAAAAAAGGNAGGDSTTHESFITAPQASVRYGLVPEDVMPEAAEPHVEPQATDDINRAYVTDLILGTTDISRDVHTITVAEWSSHLQGNQAFLRYVNELTRWERGSRSTTPPSPSMALYSHGEAGEEPPLPLEIDDNDLAMYARLFSGFAYGDAATAGQQQNNNSSAEHLQDSSGTATLISSGTQSSFPLPPLRTPSGRQCPQATRTPSPGLFYRTTESVRAAQDRLVELRRSSQGASAREHRNVVLSSDGDATFDLDPDSFIWWRPWEELPAGEGETEWQEELGNAHTLTSPGTLEADIMRHGCTHEEMEAVTAIMMLAERGGSESVQGRVEDTNTASSDALGCSSPSPLILPSPISSPSTRFSLTRRLSATVDRLRRRSANLLSGGTSSTTIQEQEASGDTVLGSSFIRNTPPPEALRSLQANTDTAEEQDSAEQGIGGGARGRGRKLSRLRPLSSARLRLPRSERLTFFSLRSASPPARDVEQDDDQQLLQRHNGRASGSAREADADEESDDGVPSSPSLSSSVASQIVHRFRSSTSLFAAARRSKRNSRPSSSRPLTHAASDASMRTASTAASLMAVPASPSSPLNRLAPEPPASIPRKRWSTFFRGSSKASSNASTSNASGRLDAAAPSPSSSRFPTSSAAPARKRRSVNGFIDPTTPMAVRIATEGDLRSGEYEGLLGSSESGSMFNDRDWGRDHYDDMMDVDADHETAVGDVPITAGAHEAEADLTPTRGVPTIGISAPDSTSSLATAAQATWDEAMAMSVERQPRATATITNGPCTPDNSSIPWPTVWADLSPSQRRHCRVQLGEQYTQTSDYEYHPSFTANGEQGQTSTQTCDYDDSAVEPGTSDYMADSGHHESVTTVKAARAVGTASAEGSAIELEEESEDQPAPPPLPPAAPQTRSESGFGSMSTSTSTESSAFFCAWSQVGLRRSSF
ncbi:hypothetical protein BDZ90DRAFT_158132 [Jaminaea rosea]|uniref:Uncharacterized protein n=1 Tax=Jaminaea rosea TaxID=1569628 RepID=A0A316URQ1_9BASI|nr:hypothetical protein BDZ90DRAFT_158132 [Jaminaea rosea]PWN27966.1 hypothetical protein BDZ90DRAFT_158132 [Jaminaea rosea]